MPIVFTSCHDCKEDIRLKQKIEEKIEVIQQRFDYSNGNDTNFISAENMFKSMVYLGHLTGYIASNPLNYRQTYTDSLSMHNDFKVWRDWYEANKCGLTLEEADSIVHYNGTSQEVK
jgi:hypothetical protein